MDETKKATTKDDIIKAASEKASSKHRIWYFLGLGLLFLYAFVRTAFTLKGFVSSSRLFQHDIYQQYLLWSGFADPKAAAEVMGQLHYLPHTWVMLTPLFALGWPVAKVLWFCCQFFLHGYICWRIIRILSLDRTQSLWFTGVYWSLMATGLTIGLGNLVVISFVALLSAYPFEARLRTWGWLFVSACKHSIVYPVFFSLLLRRWRVVVPVMAALSLCLLASFYWTGVDIMSLPDALRRGMAITNEWMRDNASVTVVPVVQAIFGETLLSQVLVWGGWFALFYAVERRITDPFAHLAALLLIGLLPIYHRGYDLILAGPALAIFIKNGRYLWTGASLLGLCGMLEMGLKKVAFESPTGSIMAMRIHTLFWIFFMVACLFRLANQEKSASRTAVPKESLIK